MGLTLGPRCEFLKRLADKCSVLPHNTSSLVLLGSLELLDVCFMIEDDSSKFLMGFLMGQSGDLLLRDVLRSLSTLLNGALDDS